MSGKKTINSIPSDELKIQQTSLQNEDETKGCTSETSEFIGPEEIEVQTSNESATNDTTNNVMNSEAQSEPEGTETLLRDRPNSIAHSESKNKFKKLKRSLSGRFRKLEHRQTSSSHLEYVREESSSNLHLNNNNVSSPNLSTNGGNNMMRRSSTHQSPRYQDEKDSHPKPKKKFSLKHSDSKKELREQSKSEKDLKKAMERHKNHEKYDKNDKEPPVPLVRDNSLHTLIRRGVSPQTFAKHLKKYTMVDQRDENDQTPLHICCNLGNAEILKLLLKRGAFVNSRDMNGFTPLHCSLIANDLLLAEILLQVRGIDVTILNHQNASALHYFARIPVNDDNMVLYRNVLDLLVQNGVNVNIQNKQGETALHSACLKTNIHTAAFLIERGAECNVVTTMGEGCLTYAIRYGNTRLVRLLLENGADPTLLTFDGHNAVDIAEEYSHSDILDCFESVIGEPLPTDTAIKSLPSIELRNSPRYKINSKLTKEGWVEYFVDGNWTKVWAKNTNLSLSLFADDTCEEEKSFLNLTTMEVLSEEDPFMIADQPYWRLIISPRQLKKTSPQSTNIIAKNQNINNNKEKNNSNNNANNSMINNNSNNNNNDKSDSEKEIEDNIYDTNATILAVQNSELRDEWVDIIEKITSTHHNLDKIYERLRQLSNPRLKLRNKCKLLTQSVTGRGVELVHNLITKNFKCDFICDTILQNIPLTAPALSEIIDVDDEQFFSNFVQFLLHRDIFVSFLKEAINYDIGKISSGDILFREVSFSTRLLSTYLEGSEGKDYLKATVLLLVNAIINIDGSFEISPVNCPDKNALERNLDQICELSQFFLDRVMISIPRFPLKFREIIQYTKKIVDSMYPNMTHAVIGGFVFLRYLCPAIVCPDRFGLISKDRLSSKTSRGLILISRLVQSVSNGVELEGSKELKRLNPFIVKNRLYVNILFDNLTNKESIKLQRLDISQNAKLTKDESDALEGAIASTLSNSLPRMKDLLVHFGNNQK